MLIDDKLIFMLLFTRLFELLPSICIISENFIYITARPSKYAFYKFHWFSDHLLLAEIYET